MPSALSSTRLVRIVPMLTKLAQQSHEMREETIGYVDYNYDNDDANENGNDGERARDSNKRMKRRSFFGSAILDIGT